MDDRMFDMIMDHERRVQAYIDSKRFTGTDHHVGSEYDADSNNGMSMSQQQQQHQHQQQQYIDTVCPLGVTAETMLSARVTQHELHPAMHGIFGDRTEEGCIDDVCNDSHAELCVEQPMQFSFPDTYGGMHTNEPLSAVDIDPIPYFGDHDLGAYNQQTQQQPMLQPFASNPMMDASFLGNVPPHQQQQPRPSLLQQYQYNPHNAVVAATTTSALSIDWEVYDLLDEFVTNTVMNEELMREPLPPSLSLVQPPMDSFPPHHTIAMEQHPQEYLHNETYEDIFQV
jgi:hypothetical protein